MVTLEGCTPADLFSWASFRAFARRDGLSRGMTADAADEYARSVTRTLQGSCFRGRLTLHDLRDKFFKREVPACRG